MNRDQLFLPQSEDEPKNVAGKLLSLVVQKTASLTPSPWCQNGTKSSEQLLFATLNIHKIPANLTSPNSELYIIAIEFGNLYYRTERD